MNVMKSIVIFIFMLLCLPVVGQDVHFSQIRHAPLMVNPALAGLENKLQATVNYRNQWNSVAEPFETIGASFDFRLKENPTSNGFLAGGINFFRDQAGRAKVTTTNANLNLAYHLYLNRNSSLGLAIQGGFGQRGLSPENGTWSTQFINSGFDQSLASGEQFEATNTSFMDAGAGVVYNYRSELNGSRKHSSRAISVGAAAYHVNQPKQSFLLDGDDRLAVRWSFFAHGNYALANSRSSLLPGIYYNRQGTFQELLFGTYLRTVIGQSSKITGFRNESALSFGIFHRLGDAFITKFLIEYGRFSLGMSYDFNVSKLTTASQGRGGVELLLRFELPGTYRGARSRIR